MYHLITSVVKKTAGGMFDRDFEITKVQISVWKAFVDLVVNATTTDLSAKWDSFLLGLKRPKDRDYMETYIGPFLSQIVESCAVWLEGADEETTNYCEAGNSLVKGTGELNTSCTFMMGLDCMEKSLDTTARNQKQRDKLFDSLKDVALAHLKDGYKWFPQSVYSSLPRHFVSFVRRLFPGAGIPFMNNVVLAGTLRVSEVTSQFHDDPQAYADTLRESFAWTPKVGFYVGSAFAEPKFIVGSVFVLLLLSAACRIQVYCWIGLSPSFLLFNMGSAFAEYAEPL
jgi:hypothetical protein